MDVTTTDLYEVSFYLTEGCLIDSISCREEAGRDVCTFWCTGKNIERLQFEYLEGMARPNLIAFRRAYGRAHAFAYEAKKKFKREKAAERQEREAQTGGRL